MSIAKSGASPLAEEINRLPISRVLAIRFSSSCSLIEAA
jgi:hypothetical protein